MYQYFPSEQQQKQIEAAYQGHLIMLHDALFHLLDALLTLVLFIISLLHAVCQLLYGIVGMTMWALGIWKMCLLMLKAYVADQTKHPVQEVLPHGHK